MLKGVFQGENRAPRMSEQSCRLQVRVRSHCVEIIEIRLQGDIAGFYASYGSSASSLVVVDEPVCTSQPIQIGQEIAAIEIRPPVQDDNGLSPADFSPIKRCLIHRNAAFPRRCLAIALKGP